MAKIASPAYKHMTASQLRASIRLGEEIWSGEADLVELNKRSLALRGKEKDGSGRKSGKMSKEEVKAMAKIVRKRKASEEEPSPDAKKVRRADEGAEDPTATLSSSSTTTGPSLDLEPIKTRIATAPLSPFRKLLLTTLLQVPRGHYTTYGILATHLHSSARAVGSALRNNPFAPEVPCHRVLATGGGIGGFKGSWGRGGKEGVNDGEKRTLLRGEGVRFDGVGRVVGGPWDGFK